MEWLASPPFTGLHGRSLYDDREDRQRDKLPPIECQGPENPDDCAAVRNSRRFREQIGADENQA